MDIKLIQEKIENDLISATSLASLEEVRIKYLGRKGLFAQLTSFIPTLVPEERGAFGKEVNILKNKLLSAIAEKENLLKKFALMNKDGVMLYE